MARSAPPVCRAAGAHRLAPPPPGYRRRRPETTELYEALRRHTRTWLEQLEEGGGELPGYVVAEVERYLTCGVLAHGFVRAWCPNCRDDLLVAFSCKGRGFCPGCCGRRMADRSARWVDGLLPDVPWRQWVLSLPWDLRLRAAWSPRVLTAIVERFIAALRREFREEHRRRGGRGGEVAAATAIQRFGSALNLNVHLHVLVADGVWFDGSGGGPEFRPVAVDDRLVRRVVERAGRRVEQWLVDQGIWDPAAFREELDSEDRASCRRGPRRRPRWSPRVRARGDGSVGSAWTAASATS